MDYVIGLIEIARSNRLQENISQIKKYLNNLTFYIDLALLPENWLTKNPLREDEYLEILDSIYQSAGVDFLSGLAYIDIDGKVVSRGYSIINGKINNICEKIFPSKAVGERGKITPGRLLGPINAKGIVIGCIGCVDIFYPEIARTHSIRGAQLLYNPAAITMDRLKLWHSVLSTRAAENIVFVAGVNSLGTLYPDGRITGGGSKVFAPDGEELKAIDSKIIKIYKIKIEYIGEVSRRWAFKEDLLSQKPYTIYEKSLENKFETWQTKSWREGEGHGGIR